MEGLFVACLGLSFRSVSIYTIRLHSSIIEEFELSIDEIWQINQEVANGTLIPNFNGQMRALFY